MLNWFSAIELIAASQSERDLWSLICSTKCVGTVAHCLSVHGLACKAKPKEGTEEGNGGISDLKKH